MAVQRVIDSDTEIPIEEHFKVSAGPGAGKTAFLVNHIHHVLRDSTRLSSMRKIACITYTNVGVDTLRDRLGDALDSIEVSTIHSFLYKHIVKPYLWVLADEYEFDYAAIDGHDEVVPGHTIYSEWQKETKQSYISDEAKAKCALMRLRWKINSEGILEIDFSKNYVAKIGKYSITKSSLFQYKKICWKNGLISHDDVLALAYMIIEKENRVLDIIRGKFPYLFIDEFQDTNPLQTKFLNVLSDCESIVGVIGDACQSIFEFQGADVKQFMEFYLNGMQEYLIEANKRSTEEIITVLNYMRSDMHQSSPQKKHGNKPIALIGDFLKAHKEALNQCGKDSLYVLSYRHEVYKCVQFGIEHSSFDKDLVNYLRFQDNNNKRGKKILFLVYALEYAKAKRISEAMKYMRKAYIYEAADNNFNEYDGINLLSKLLEQYDEIKNLSVADFYNNYIFGVMGTKSRVSRGAVKIYYGNHSYQELACTLSMEEYGKYRSIHQAKGAEFNNVLVVISPEDKTDSIEFLMNPDMEKESHRVYYVAMSRAKERLFISIPCVNDLEQQSLLSCGFGSVKFLD